LPVQAKWSTPLAATGTLETQPLVIDGIMYATAGNRVRSRRKDRPQIWNFTRQQKARNPNEINPFNRGVAVLGNRVFVGTLDAALVALDARTGRQLWETQVADTLMGHTITSAPLIVKDKVVIGVTGGEFGPRGFLDAYDAASGKQLWRFYSVPARVNSAMTPGKETAGSLEEARCG
jgi:outer membrane protein assembly factor BamB